MSHPTMQHKELADRVMENVRGSTIASKLIHDLRTGMASPDALLDAIRGCKDGERLRGLCRTIQKAVERSAT